MGTVYMWGCVCVCVCIAWMVCRVLYTIYTSERQGNCTHPCTIRRVTTRCNDLDATAVAEHRPRRRTDTTSSTAQIVEAKLNMPTVLFLLLFTFSF